MYEIRIYSPKFLDEQVRIGSYIFDKWKMGGQTRKGQLLHKYSQSTFDPETRLYAFKNGRMVGFITADPSIGDHKAFFEFPFVIPEHEEASEVLISHLINVLKKKNINKLIARAGEYWGNTKELAEQYSFKPTDDMVRLGEISSFYSPEWLNIDTSQTEDYVHEQHQTEVRELFKEVLKLDEKGLDRVMSRLNHENGKLLQNPWNIKYFWTSKQVLIENDAIVGFGSAFHNLTFPPSTSVLGSLVSTSHGHDKTIIAGIVQNLHKIGDDTLAIHTGQWGFPDERRFLDFVDRFRPVLSYWEKDI